MEVYKDKLVTASTPAKPAGKGHIRIVTEKDFSSLSHEEFVQLMSSTLYCSVSLFETLSPHGTNILLSDMGGSVAEVLARTEGDGLNFQWQALQLAPAEMDSIAAKIKDTCDYIGVAKSPDKKILSVPSPRETPVNSVQVKEGKVNYLLKQLQRTP